MVTALTLAGGAARRTELGALGVTARAIDAALRTGNAKAAGFGTYALPDCPAEIVAARRWRATLGCLTACAHLGLPLWREPDVPHLVVPRGRSDSRRDEAERASVRLHRTATATGSPLVIPALAAVDQAGWCTSPAEQLVVVDAALRRSLVTPRDLSRLAHRDSRRREWLRHVASAKAESPLETVSRVLFLLAELRVAEQVSIRGVGRVDFVVEDSLVIEADGWEFHGDRGAFERDRERDRMLAARGFAVVRLTSRDLRGDLHELVTDIAAAAGRVPHRKFEERLAWAFAR